MLNRIQQTFEKVTYIRNQSVYKPKDKVNYVYIVREGDFLQCVKVPKIIERQLPMDDLIGPNQVSLRETDKIDEDVKIFNSSLGDVPPMAVAKKESTAHG